MSKRSSKSKGKISGSRATKSDGQKLPVTVRGVIATLLISALTLWVYWPALHGGWIGDDSIYVTHNWLLLDPARLWKAWFQPGSFIEYYPIEQTVQWLQWQLWGMDTWGYHITNVVLHLIGALLVWHLFHKLGLRLAWLGGLIFAIHPMQVESVAFINELKNTLSLPPLLLAMCAWLDFEKHHETRHYLRSMGWFVVAMLAKISVAPFPFLILLYAWYLRRRITRADIKVSAPFFGISLAFGVLTIWAGQLYAHSSHAIPAAIPLGGFFSRIALAGLSAEFYFSRCFLPIQPSPMYPQWPVASPNLLQFLPWLLFGGVFALLWNNRLTWGRPALLGFGFFLIFISPFLGFNQASYMATLWVMDHFLYIPIIGFIGLSVAAMGAIENLLVQNPMRVMGRAIVCVILALLAIESHSYAAKFVNEEALMRYAIQVNPQSWQARYILASDLINRNALPEARQELQAANVLHPGYSKIHLCLGTVDCQLGDKDGGIKQFEEAAQIDPGDAQIYDAWGRAFFQAGQVVEAIQQYRHSINLDPNDPSAHTHLGIALFQQGDVTRGFHEFDEATRINPREVEAYMNRGVAMASLGRISEAANQFETVLRLDPDNAFARNYLSRMRLEAAHPSQH